MSTNNSGVVMFQSFLPPKRWCFRVFHRYANHLFRKRVAYQGAFIPSEPQGAGPWSGNFLGKGPGRCRPLVGGTSECSQIAETIRRLYVIH